MIPLIPQDKFTALHTHYITVSVSSYFCEEQIIHALISVGCNLKLSHCCHVTSRFTNGTFVALTVRSERTILCIAEESMIASKGL